MSVILSLTLMTASLAGDATPNAAAAAGALCAALVMSLAAAARRKRG